MTNTETRSAVVAEALSWLGTPYHHAARIKGAGVDCAQILIAVFEATGLIEEFKPAEYPRDWMMHRSEEVFLSHIHSRSIEVVTPQPGDVALYRVGRCFAHGAIVIDWPRVVHADSRVGEVTMAQGDQGFLSNREVRFFSVLKS
jgi:cell wall-associated NlpC family hydrolase